MSKIIVNIASTITFCAGAAEARELRVGTNIWPGYEPLYVAANHMPDFGSTDIKIQRYYNASEVSSALEIGLIDVAALTLDEAVMVADKGLDISVIAVMDVSDGADKVCTTLSDFDVKDAQVAYEESALGGYFLSKFLEHSGSELKDVASLVSLPVDTHLEAIQQNTANTFVTFEPFSKHLKAEGCQEIFNSSMDPYVIIDVLVLNNEQLASGDVSRQQVAALVKAWFWALSKVAAENEIAMGDIASGLGVTVSELMEIYTELRLPDAAENIELFASGILADRSNEIFQFLKDTQRIGAADTLKDLTFKLDTKYIEH